jgi:hypothetical protein
MSKAKLAKWPWREHQRRWRLKPWHALYLQTLQARWTALHAYWPSRNQKGFKGALFTWLRATVSRDAVDGLLTAFHLNEDELTTILNSVRSNRRLFDLFDDAASCKFRLQAAREVTAA